MHRIGALAILLASYCFQRVAAANTTCTDPSIYVDIHLREVDGKPSDFQYGLFMGLGSPSQNQSLWPSLSNNETYISSEDFCGPQASANCNNYTHGHFSTEVSTSWTETFSYRSADSPTTIEGINLTTGTDDFHIYTHYFDPSPASETTIQNYTINVLSEYESPASPFFLTGTVGFGPGSTLLDSLKGAGKITSKIVGLYLGTAYGRAGGIANGSIVLGGYDQGRIQGDIHEYAQVAPPSPDASSLQLSIKQVALVLPGNITIGLIPNEGFEAYLTTSQYELQFPPDVTQALASALTASPTNDSSNALKASKSFNGNLTITLADGMVVSFPPEWITNASNLTPFSAGAPTTNNTTENSTAAPLLFGVAFLHHLYLTVNHESSTFSLAEANVFNNFVQPLSLCPGELPIAAAAPSQSNFTKYGYAGIILGSVVGGIGLLFFLWFVLRKRYAWKRTQQSDKAVENGTGETMVDGKPKKSSMKRSLRNKTRSIVRFASSPKVVPTQTDSEKTEHVPYGNFNGTADKDDYVATVTIPVQYSISGSSPPVSAHELTSFSKISSTWNQSHPPPSYTSNNISNATIGKAITTDSTHDLPAQAFTRTTTFDRPQYATHAVMTPMTSTPHTSNPLLGNHHSNFAHIDDEDDSDLHLEPHELGAIANSSTENLNTPRATITETQKRQTLGLTVDTSAAQSRNSSVRGPKGARKKPIPLPIRIIHEGSGEGRRSGAQTRGYPAKKGGGSALKRMFLASRD